MGGNVLSAVQQFNEETKRRTQELQAAWNELSWTSFNATTETTWRVNPRQQIAGTVQRDDDDSPLVLKFLKVPLYVVDLVEQDEDRKINLEVSTTQIEV